ncbi:SDR family oxidoreductase [Sphingomonas sp. A2-49]|uniref:SDR family NAD(P)-dependent oxidoreductase n=1 Tax=Sphingomonas sp. A2-49 TaxID=1391375 RepID=UPI0021D13D15|nr:SDR family oxidoreductase [Sphingomonas sp. A2-49]MCU6453136.1 SDR family oxidoreductase [Sphingomonas sp. A2-49]
MGLMEGNVALVTGAGAGIGRGIARLFCREGAQVVVAEFDAERGRAVVAECEELGGSALFVHTDVGDKASVERAIQTAVDTFGGLDTLVNNAFAPSPEVLLEQKTDAILARTLDTTMWATWWAMQAAYPHFRARGGGSVINFYSIDADTGAWRHADYNMGKSAIRGLTHSAASEWGRFNIRVNAIAPAAAGLSFERLCREHPGFEKVSASAKPLNRVGYPEEDIAPVAVFLASRMAGFVTGQTINVDGGLHLWGFNSKPGNLEALDALT